MKKSILLSVILILAISASVYLLKWEENDENTEVIEKNLVVPNGGEKYTNSSDEDIFLDFLNGEGEAIKDEMAVEETVNENMRFNWGMGEKYDINDLTKIYCGIGGLAASDYSCVYNFLYDNKGVYGIVLKYTRDVPMLTTYFVIVEKDGLLRIVLAANDYDRVHGEVYDNGSFVIYNNMGTTFKENAYVIQNRRFLCAYNAEGKWGDAPEKDDDFQKKISEIIEKHKDENEDVLFDNLLITVYETEFGNIYTYTIYEECETLNTCIEEIIEAGIPIYSEENADVLLREKSSLYGILAKGNHIDKWNELNIDFMKENDIVR